MNKGFTLLETLVAIAILALAIVGPLTLAVKSISAISVSQNQITAFYLGQEAIEAVRNIRDTNFLKGNNWLKGLNFCGNNGCYIDIPRGSIVTICSPDCPVLRYDDDWFYNYGSGNDTIFKRVVKITNPVGGNSEEASVEVTMTWQDKSRQKTLILEENIFDWRL